jgi:predicted nucleic-acid-binding Zn-ribbon protein
MSWTDWFGNVEQERNPRRYRAADRRISCSHCGHGRFVEDTVKLVSPSAALFDAEYSSPDATTLTCDRCGRIEWFATPPESIGTD